MTFFLFFWSLAQNSWNFAVKTFVFCLHSRIQSINVFVPPKICLCPPVTLSWRRACVTRLQIIYDTCFDFRVLIIICSLPFSSQKIKVQRRHMQARRFPGGSPVPPKICICRQGCRSLLSMGGDNLQFYPNFALFSTLGE